MASPTAGDDDPQLFRICFAAKSDTGMERSNNEDSWGSSAEDPLHVVVAVADGVSGEEGGEVASRMAVDELIRAYRLSPARWGAAKRLYRAAQQANIEVHDRALVVTELCRMSTTLTAVAIDGADAYAAHVGDSRLYLIREDGITQKSKDHTLAASKQRIGLMTAKRAKAHPDRSVLTRSLGRELIVGVDQISFPLQADDRLLLCSDGLYNVLEDDELLRIVREGTPEAACESLVATANARGTPDNLTAAVIHVTGVPPESALRDGWRGRIARMLGR